MRATKSLASSLSRKSTKFSVETDHLRYGSSPVLVTTISGWNDAGKALHKEECLTDIKHAWTDMCKHAWTDMCSLNLHRRTRAAAHRAGIGL